MSFDLNLYSEVTAERFQTEKWGAAVLSAEHRCTSKFILDIFKPRIREGSMCIFPTCPSPSLNTYRHLFNSVLPISPTSFYLFLSGIFFKAHPRPLSFNLWICHYASLVDFKIFAIITESQSAANENVQGAHVYLSPSSPLGSILHK